MSFRRCAAPAIAALMVTASWSGSARAEVILQWFETPWAEVEARIPEVAAAGYDALWLPPPTKGTEGERDVGFAVFDRFDLGDQSQRGTTPTRYGTTDELKSMVRTAHRFGIRVYFDVVMNHNGNPNGIENIGVSLQPVELDGFPGTSIWDYHVLPARPSSGGNCNDGSTGCAFCARQPSAAADDDFNGASFNGRQWRVLNPNGSYINATGGEVCVREGEGGEDRIATMTLADALTAPGAPDPSLPIFDGMTVLVRAPRMFEFTDFDFQVTNWALLGLHDFATEQYEDGAGPTDLDGTNAITGTPLPRFIRDEDRPDTYQYETNSQPHDEDIREYLMRWIRWLMLETQADGFRLDAIKHIWPNFFGSDFPGDRIAFVKIIQDTYDELNGFTDTDDADLIDDAAVFGEDFTGDCGALKPYIDTGMRALDFPLFFSLGDLMFGGDIGQYSAPGGGSCADASVGSFKGLNRRSGVAFAHSHDECQKNESPDTNNLSGTFSRCNNNGGGRADLVYAYILLREADGTVFYDGNRWTPQSFVRSGRPDGLVEVAGEQTLDTLPVLVNGARRVGRGAMQNRWVGADGYAFERVVAGGAAGIVFLSDREGQTTWGGPGSTENSFVVTTFPPGTELCELTGRSLSFAGGCYPVLDPQAQRDAGEAAQVDAAIANFQAANGALPQGTFGVFYSGIPGGSRDNYAVYAPPAFAAPEGDGDDVVEVRDVDVGGLSPGVHALHVRFSRQVQGAADAQDEVVLALCKPSSSLGTDVCGVSTSGAPPATDPVAAGLVEVLVDGSAAARLAVQTAPARALPNGTAVSAAKAFHVVVGGDTMDIIVRTGAALAVDDIAVRIDEDPFSVPGFLLDDTAERFLDGFTKLFPPGVTPPDSGVVGEGEGEGEGEGGEGEGESDAGVINPNDDDDDDGVLNGIDNCIGTANPQQEDFDEDRVGDACDLCVLEGSSAEEPVDATGCRPVSDEERARIVAIAKAIAGRAGPTNETDLDGDGSVNVHDLEQAIAEAHQ